MTDNYQENNSGNEAGVEQKVCSGICPKEERRESMPRVKNLEIKVEPKGFSCEPITNEVVALDEDHNNHEIVYVGKVNRMRAGYSEGYTDVFVSGHIYLSKYERIKGTKKKIRFNLARFKFEQEEIPYVRDKKIWSVVRNTDMLVSYSKLFVDIKNDVRGFAYSRGIGLTNDLLNLVFNPIIEEFNNRLNLFKKMTTIANAKPSTD
jgi:hypothetical protein